MLHESPATASLHSATPKRKMNLAFWIYAHPIFSEKGKDIFLFGVLPSKYSGSLAGLQFGLVKAEKLFSGEKGFSALPRLLYRPQKGVWGMNAGGFPIRHFFWRQTLNFKKD